MNVKNLTQLRSFIHCATSIKNWVLKEQWDERFEEIMIERIWKGMKYDDERNQVDKTVKDDKTKTKNRDKKTEIVNKWTFNRLSNDARVRLTNRIFIADIVHLMINFSIQVFLSPDKRTSGIFCEFVGCDQTSMELNPLCWLILDCENRSVELFWEPCEHEPKFWLNCSLSHISRLKNKKICND